MFYFHNVKGGENVLLELYKYILKKSFIDIYPKLGITFRMMLCTTGSNSSAEQSFLALINVQN